MNPIIKSLLALSAIIGFVMASPVEFKSLDTEIAPAAEGDVNYRLSRDIEPRRYDLKLTPYFENETAEAFKQEFTFDGVVSILLQPMKFGLQQIVLHVNDLKIETYKLERANTGGDPISVAGGDYKPEQYDAVTDKWTINLPQPLTQVEHNLTVYYTGFMRDDMEGFYRSYYMENGKKVWMASTQLQQTEARRAFPCFDEPGFKTPFKLTMVAPTPMHTLSNTQINGTSTEMINGRNRTIYQFAETPKMSTYLLAFIVSNYEGLTNSNNTFGVYARPAAKQQTQLALNFGQDMLAKLGDYVGIDYYSVDKVKKMDMAAIPDFSAGAMENWGLLTYRETGVLFYADDTPTLNEQRIIAVIAHEQAHMWFGDLVTCNWWSETWLNEGFARYFQYFGVAMLKPDWDLEEQFVVENLQQSMQLDSTDSTHPMTDLTVNTKSQVSGMFDNISYNKAASVIRMLSHYIGMKKFQETLHHHLERKRGEAVVPDDLLTAINEVNPGEGEVGRWFAPWPQNPGFPLVTVTLVNQTLTLKQKRFMRSEADNNKTERYNIPITYTIDSKNYEDTTPKVIFKIEDGLMKTINLPEKPQKYIILNPKQTGYYRVNYDVDNWMKIKEALFKDNHDNIHVMNRAQIVDDLFNLARAGIVKYDTAVDIIRYIKKEKHYIPWLSAISHGLTFLSQRVNGEKNAEVFSWFIKDTMDEIYKQLKFAPQTTDRRTDIYNRINVATWACKYGHEECIKDAKEIFAKFMGAPQTRINKDQRSYVYCNAVRYGGKAEFDFLYERFLKEDIAAEQLNLLIGMGCTKDKDSANKYLARIITTDDIRPQDLSGAINNVLNSNPEGPTFIYDYITANHAIWRTKMGGLGTLSTVAGRFTTKEQFEKYEAFLSEKKTDLGTTYDSLLKSSTSLRKNLDWDETHMKEFMEHLTKLKNSAPVKTISILASLISVAVLFLFN